MNAEQRELIESNKDYYNAIDLSLEVRAFIDSKIGRILIERAEAERMSALDELVNIRASDMEGIRALQSTIKRAESIQIWMAEIIQEGLSAEEQLLKQDAAEGSPE